MRVKSFKVINNDLLGDLDLDFTIGDEVCNRVIIAGENGVGKSTLLNLITESIYFSFSDDVFGMATLLVNFFKGSFKA